MDLPTTKLAYFDDMQDLQSTASLVASFKDEGRFVVVVDSTIFHPQGGGQPSDTGFISDEKGQFKFIVHDVRLKNGVILHFGVFDPQNSELALDKGRTVNLNVDRVRRELNSRLHSAGHLLDICMRNMGLSYLEPGKGYHFPDGPFVEYKGTVPQNEVQKWPKELETEANRLISIGGKVSAIVLPYEEAAQVCGGRLPDYISEGSSPRIVTIGDNFGCPCGGTHVADISDIKSLKLGQRAKGDQHSGKGLPSREAVRRLASLCATPSAIRHPVLDADGEVQRRFLRTISTLWKAVPQIRIKKGITKVLYTIGS